MEEAGIIVSNIRLPESLGGEGLRLGTNETTRRGADEATMGEIAQLVADLLLSRRSVRKVRSDVRSMAEALGDYAYTWPDAIA